MFKLVWLSLKRKGCHESYIQRKNAVSDIIFIKISSNNALKLSTMQSNYPIPTS